MKTLPIHSSSQACATTNIHALLNALGKVGVALLAALLLGLALEYVPLATTGWSLPTDPTNAAAFTA